MERIEILGTDIDRASLAAAARGQFKDGDFAETPAELRERYFSSTVPFTVSPAIAKLARFERRDLLEDGPPPQGGGFHLIACRNVLIYFDRETQERLFEAFYRSLAPGGFLVLGKVETLLGPARARFAAVDARERIFRRL
jgi:chemotaxis methyl-accepting protein methylase